MTSIKKLAWRWFKETWLGRIIRHWDDNPVWPWQQARIRRAVDRAFSAAEPLVLHRAIKLDGSWPEAADARPVLFAACDGGYFDRFGQYLAISSLVRSPGTRVHLHVYQPTPECIDRCRALTARWPGRLTISHESAERNPYGKPNTFYFAAGRFAIASRLRETIAAPIVMIDADGLVVRDLQSGFDDFSGCSAGFILQDDSVAHYRQILASAVYIGTDAEARDFFTRLGDAMDLALQDRGRYHVDQIGIHYALEWRAGHGRPLKVENIDMSWSDSDFDKDALIWSTRGPRKVRFEELLATFRDLPATEPPAAMPVPAP